MTCSLKKNEATPSNVLKRFEELRMRRYQNGLLLQTYEQDVADSFYARNRVVCDGDAIIRWQAARDRRKFLDNQIRQCENQLINQLNIEKREKEAAKLKLLKSMQLLGKKESNDDLRN